MKMRIKIDINTPTNIKTENSAICEVRLKIGHILCFQISQMMLTLYFGDLPAGLTNNDKYLSLSSLYLKRGQ